MTSPLLFAILAHWIIVQYIVEAKISEPLRDFVAGKHKTIICPKDRFNVGVTITIDDCWPGTEIRRPKLAYLVTCRMCSGFWVAVGFGLVLGFSPVKTLALAAASHWLFVVQRIAEKLAR